jgi:multidrug transporter EmrE-like cation transporter
MRNAWVTLAVAIEAEGVATRLRNASHGFTRRWPSLTTVLGHAVAF